MKLKPKVKSLDSVPEKYQELYVEQDDGTFIIPGLVEKDQLNEFRSSNNKLKSQVESMQQQLDKFKDVDPEKYKKALEALEKLEGDEEKKMLEEGKIDELIEQRTARMKQDYEAQLTQRDKQLEQFAGQRDLFKGKLSSSLLTERLMDSMSELKIKPAPKALPDIRARAAAIFRMTDDADLRPLDEKGNPIYGKDSSTELTMKEFLGGLAEDAGHLFGEVTGGGSGGGSGGGVRQVAGKKVIDASDSEAFLANLDKVASGEVEAR